MLILDGSIHIKLVDLKTLNLFENHLYGELPETLPSLSQLQVRRDVWFGAIPVYPIYYASPTCKVLDIGRNNLGGDLNVAEKPLWWNFPDIKTLMLGNNDFTVRQIDWSIHIFRASPACIR